MHRNLQKVKVQLAVIRKGPHYDQYGHLHKLLKADVIFGLSKTCHYYWNVWGCVIERNGKWGHAKNDLSTRSHIRGKQLQQTMCQLHKMSIFWLKVYLDVHNSLYWLCLFQKTRTMAQKVPTPKQIQQTLLKYRQVSMEWTVVICAIVYELSLYWTVCIVWIKFYVDYHLPTLLAKCKLSKSNHLTGFIQGLWYLAKSPGKSITTCK